MNNIVKIATFFLDILFSLIFLLLVYFSIAFMGMIGETKLSLTLIQSIPNLINLIIMAGLIVLSIIFYIKEKYKKSLILSMLPVINVIGFIAILVQVSYPK